VRRLVKVVDFPFLYHRMKIFAGYPDGRLCVYSNVTVGSLSHAHVTQLPQKHHCPINFLSTYKLTYLAALDSEGFLSVWQLSGETAIRFLFHVFLSDVGTITFFKCSKEYVFIGHADGKVVVQPIAENLDEVKTDVNVENRNDVIQIPAVGTASFGSTQPIQIPSRNGSNSMGTNSPLSTSLPASSSVQASSPKMLPIVPMQKVQFNRLFNGKVISKVSCLVPNQTCIIFSKTSSEITLLNLVKLSTLVIRTDSSEITSLKSMIINETSFLIVTGDSMGTINVYHLVLDRALSDYKVISSSSYAGLHAPITHVHIDAFHVVGLTNHGDLAVWDSVSKIILKSLNI
jgi:hypothetical protein